MCAKRTRLSSFWSTSRASWNAVATENPAAFLFLETHHHTAYLDDASVATGADLTARAVAYVRRGQRAGAIRAGQPEVLIALVLGAFTGLFKSATEHGLPLTRATLEASEEAVWALLST